MKKEVKDTIITELGELLKQYPHFYLVDLTGLNAADTSALRRKCFKSEIKLVVAKNKLLRKAFDASDVDFSALYDTLKGTTALMFCQTANVPAKRLLMLRKWYSLVPRISHSLLLSRARTRLSPTSLLSSSLQQRTLSLHSRVQLVARFTVSSRQCQRRKHKSFPVLPELPDNAGLPDSPEIQQKQKYKQIKNFK